MGLVTDKAFPEFPFDSHELDLDGVRLHYLDEGPRDGEVVVMLHGNPTWSFYYRRLVSAWRDTRRCIVPDHIGMGLSDKRNHAEVVKVRFDPAQTSLEKVLIGFWENHDPTQGDRQGNEVGH